MIWKHSASFHRQTINQLNEAHIITINKSFFKRPLLRVYQQKSIQDNNHTQKSNTNTCLSTLTLINNRPTGYNN